MLEVGVGSGLNLPFYGVRVRGKLALDPTRELVAMAQRSASATTIPVSFVEASVEAIPVEDSSVDTVVTTWTLCSVPDGIKALHEMRRVIRKRGRLLFVEHGLAPDPRVRWWQNHLTPLWRTHTTHVFASLSHPIRTMSNTAWQNGRRAAGKENPYWADLHAHDLRHTVGMRPRAANLRENRRRDPLA